MTQHAKAILLVEDDPNDVLLVQRAFRNAHIANPIHTVGHGDAAVAYLTGAGEYADRERHRCRSSSSST